MGHVAPGACMLYTNQTIFFALKPDIRISMKYLHAIKETIFYSALMHLVILILISIRENNLLVLNYFNILDIDYFFPQILDFTFSTLSSFALFIGLFVVLLYKNKTKGEDKSE